jgi:hypothetical protein
MRLFRIGLMQRLAHNYGVNISSNIARTRPRVDGDPTAVHQERPSGRRLDCFVGFFNILTTFNPQWVSIGSKSRLL